jgi:hypothetical protein
VRSATHGQGCAEHDGDNGDDESDEHHNGGHIVVGMIAGGARAAPASRKVTPAPRSSQR